MKYQKPWLTYEAQADLLIQRGLIAHREDLIKRLREVNYYRLSGYIYPFRLSDTKIQEGTTLDLIWRHYTFDRQLRLLLIDAVERIEVIVRAQLAHHFAEIHGPFGYLDPAKLPGISSRVHTQWLADLANETKRSGEVFIEHYYRKYHSEQHLPIWMLTEVMSFGKTLTFYCGVHRDIRNKIVGSFKVPEDVFRSWLKTLNIVRNVCAHHARCWNRNFGYKPILPTSRTKYPEWQAILNAPRGKVFVILTIIHYLLPHCASTTRWRTRIRLLLRRYPEISTTEMGFPADWDQLPLWKDQTVWWQRWIYRFRF